MSSISPIIRCAAAIALLSSAPARAEEMFEFLRPPTQMQIAPHGASPTSLDPARDDSRKCATAGTSTTKIVAYSSRETPGTVIIDTSYTLLFTCSATARRSAMVSGSAVKASPGRVSSRLSARANGQIVSAAGNYRSSTLSAAHDCGRRRQSAWCACDVLAEPNSHSRHQRSVVDRQAHIERLHSDDQ